MSHYETTNNESTSGTVLSGRHTNTELRTLSARPQITYIRPWSGEDEDGITTYPYMRTGHAGEFTIEGYMFDKVTTVYVSAGAGVYDGDYTSVNPFSNAVSTSAKDLSSLYPEFSASYIIDSDRYSISSPNTISITLSAPAETGNIDIILVNPAGYSLMSKDLSGSTIRVKA